MFRVFNWKNKMFNFFKLSLFFSIFVFIGCGGNSTNSPLKSKTTVQKSETNSTVQVKQETTFEKLLKDKRALNILKKMRTEKRIALVIGNNSYKYLNGLKNAVNDAKAVKEALEDLNFEVLYLENGSKKEINSYLRDFSKMLQANSGAGLFYYAGHGVEFGGVNYLIPVDAEIVDKVDVKNESVSLNDILFRMENAGNRLNIVILDACRNNPFKSESLERKVLGEYRGFATPPTAKGVYIAYSADVGQTASDGTGTNHGIFTQYLLKNIKLEGVGLNDIFKKIRKEVEKATNGQQSPASYDKTTGEFFFAFPKTYKLISEKDIEPKAKLTIITEPKDAKIAFASGILFKNGEKYKLGKYKIKFAHPKYLTKVLEIELKKDTTLKVKLKKMATLEDIKTDLVWNGQSKFVHVSAINFNEAVKKYIGLYVTPKDEFEKLAHYNQRKIDFVKRNQNNILNGWLGKQTIEKISYDAEIEQFTITLSGEDLPNLLTFNLPVPISEAKQFKQKVQNFNVFIKQQKDQLYVYGVQAKLYRHKYYMELSTKLKINTEEILKAKELKQKLQQALEKIYKMPYSEIIKLKSLSFVGLDSLKRLTQVREILKKRLSELIDSKIAFEENKSS